MTDNNPMIAAVPRELRPFLRSPEKDGGGGCIPSGIIQAEAQVFDPQGNKRRASGQGLRDRSKVRPGMALMDEADFESDLRKALRQSAKEARSDAPSVTRRKPRSPNLQPADNHYTREPGYDYPKKV